MNLLHDLLLSNPIGLIFLVVGLGYAIGKLRIAGFDLGPVSGVLFVALVFGHFGYEMNATVQSMGFVLFIFSVGLEAGPGFFSALRADGLRYLALSLVIGATGFVLALVLSNAMGFEPGVSAGLLAGGMTSSPTLAAAQEALRSGQVNPPSGLARDVMLTNVTTAYAITYIFGLVGLILLIRLLPRFVGIDFKAEATRLAEEVSGGIEDRAEVLNDIVARVYRVEHPEFTDTPLAEIYERYPGLGAMTHWRRDGEFLEITPESRIQIGDDVAVVGFLNHILEIGPRIGPELQETERIANEIESGRIVVSRSLNKQLDLGLAELSDRYGVFFGKIQRLGVDVPVSAQTALQAGDVLHVTGYGPAIDRLAERLGPVERGSHTETDLISFGLGIAAGLTIGALSIELGGVSIGIGTAGGLLAAGLTIGYLRAVRPTFGRVPSAARWVFMELGLLIFMAGVGLNAGGSIIETIASTGPTLFVAGVAVTVVPVVMGFVVGRWVLRIHPVLLLGAITGSMTSGGALSIVNREAGNSMPALGYTGAYAFANVLLTIAGGVILLL